MYRTINEMSNFEFEESFVQAMSMTNGSFYIELQNVKIKPENSCNKDIRLMRTNDLKVTITDVSSLKVVKEGYNVYDADEKLIKKVEDVVIEKNDIIDTIKLFAESTIISFVQQNEYIICLDTEDNTFDIIVNGTSNIEEWGRFLNVE